MLAIIIKAGKILGDKGTPNFTALANAIGCHRSSLYTWQRVPTHYVKKIVAATGGKLTAAQLRPDLAKAEALKVSRKANGGGRKGVRKRKGSKALSTTDVIVGRWGNI